MIRPALLWNDTRSAPQAARLTAELGGAKAWAEAVGLVPVASFTVTKLAWLAETEPERAARVAGVCLPHDWLTWRLAGSPALEGLVTDRDDAVYRFHVASNDGASSSILDIARAHGEIWPEITFERSISLTSATLPTLLNAHGLDATAYDALVHGRGSAPAAGSGVEAVRAAYGRGETDEFIKPTVVGEEARIRDGDAVLSFNFRPDRARQLTRALGEPEFAEFDQTANRPPE